MIEAQSQGSTPQPLRFIVAPHIVEDLGLNLYTSLPRVLVEFIANAYDADSRYAKVIMDKDAIDKARSILKAEWEYEQTQAAKEGREIARLAERTLPDALTITIEDAGCGMSRSDLQEKFLVAGRRRRGKDNAEGTSAGGRILMGRKGLGKLAGFGVAQKVTVISRTKGENHATEIILDYRDLIEVHDTNEIPIMERRLDDGGGFTESGTRIVLSRLLYEPMKSRLTTIESQAADHFAQIDPANFRIELNGNPVQPTPRVHVYAWPEPTRAVDELVDASYKTDDGRTFTFKYRLRFVEDRAALTGKDRGVRVYAHKRLASAPSLLDADTNMHGFRMTDYLDGVVYADFIDDQPEDYIATDRQALRWDSPVLYPLYTFLSERITEACYSRQKARDEEKDREVRKDVYTQQEIVGAQLSKREEEIAYRIGASLSSLHKKGYEDEAYRTQFKEVVRGLGQGQVLTALAGLARQENPALDRVVSEITKLTAAELDAFCQYAKGRISGIEALRKIVRSVDFAKAKNENILHGLLNKCPWLIDPTFFEFLTSNQAEKTVFEELERTLRVGNATAAGYDPDASDEVTPGGRNLRPDLVFLLGNQTLNRIIIVELKAPNTPLYGAHYRQLQGYVLDAERWLARRGDTSTKVEGLLIGSFAKIESQTRDVEWLEAEMNKTMNLGQCRIFGIDVLLGRAEAAHRGLLVAP